MQCYTQAGGTTGTLQVLDSNFNGALLARGLRLTGSGGIHYDESFGGQGLVNGVQYRLKEVVQHYR